MLEKGGDKVLLHKGEALDAVKRLYDEGHFGILNTMERVNKYYVVSKCRELIIMVIKSCETCQFRSRVEAIRSNPAVIMKTPMHPFFMFRIVAVVPLQKADNGNQYVLTGVCYLTRWAVAMAVSSIDEKMTVGFFYHEIVKNFGVSQYIYYQIVGQASYLLTFTTS